jgi:prophage regulatory protein
MANTILRLPAVKARTGLSRSTIYAYVASGDFPAPVSLGRRAVGWDLAEIDSWIEARLAQRGISNNLGADSVSLIGQNTTAMGVHS